MTRLNAELVGVLTEPDSRDKLMTLGLEPAPSSQGEFADLIRTEIPRLAKLIRTSGIRVE